MTQKTKNILLVLTFIIGFIIAYHVAFSKTIAIKSELTALKKESIGFEGFTNLSNTLNQRQKFVDSVLKTHNFKNISIQNNLLEFLNQEATDKQFSITDFRKPHIATENNVTLTSYQFTLNGSFNVLIETIYKLEQDYSFGRVSHINFEKKRDYRKGKNYLKCFVIVESLVSK